MSEMRKLPYVAAITEGVREVLLEQENAFVAGEDVGQAGSVFGYYAGLFDEFGGERMVDTPISEKGIIGLGVGASACGCRPIVDLMFMDFIGECMDEIANQMAKMRFMFGGGVTLPVTVITMAGAGMNLAAQHSQSLEAWLAHLPGVKVVMPSNAYDAKGMIIAAARDDNPVFVVLNKASLALQSEVPEGAYEVEIGKAKVVREGSNFTIIAISRMVHEATKAA
ncbi:MAG: pyruvate/2-oxoglutarate/acetoin dehydrogenase E1 component, partial [Candidatus Azotimanducaceae bacterium]